MIDTDNIRLTVAKGLKNYLGCQMIKSDQNAEPPAYPYGVYKITTLATQNNGTYGEYKDNKARKPMKQIWSLSFLSNTEAEAISYANKARTWLDYVGTVYLNDNNVIVEQVGVVGDRNNVLTAEYEYKYGFDCTFWVLDEVDIPDNGTVETVTMGEDKNASLESRLDGVDEIAYSGNQAQDGEDELNELLKNRLSGV